MAARIGGYRTNVLRNEELVVVLPNIALDSLQSIIYDEKKRSRGVNTGSQHIKIDDRRRFAGLSSDESSLDQIEDDDQIQSISLSASRWADGSDCNHLGEADREEMSKRRKIMPRDVSISRQSSPELGEIISREGSASAESNSYASEGDQDYMVVDGEYTDQLCDIDIEAEDDHDQQTQRHFNMLHSCRSVDEFENLGKISEGTYGVVFKARDKKTGELVALKKVKLEKRTEGFPLTALREINILLSFSHPSIVNVKEVVVDGFDSVYMVMEYMEHDLKSLMEKMKRRFCESEVKCLMIQLLEGVKHLHDNWVLHRDLKTSNILVNNHGELKICDFGLARQYGSPLKPYTHMVVTLWYRAPELLLGGKEYSTAVDMWSLGCIMAELLAKEPLFNGEKELDQLNKIFQILGTPNERIWPGFSKLPGSRANLSRKPYNNNLREKFPPVTLFGRPKLSEAGFDLLSKLLAYDPKKRISIEDALKHEWFREEPLPKAKEFMPSFPDRHLRR